MLGGTCQNVTYTLKYCSDLYDAFQIARKGCTELVRTYRDDESGQQFGWQNASERIALYAKLPKKKREVYRIWEGLHKTFWNVLDSDNVLQQRRTERIGT